MNSLLTIITMMIGVILGMNDYSGHQLVRIQVESVDQAVILSGIRDMFDFWTEVVPGRTVDIRCNPDTCDILFDITSDMKVEVLQSNLEPLVVQSAMRTTNLSNLSTSHSMDWISYHPIEDIHGYMDYLEANYDFVTTESIGSSYEGSDMRILKVCRGGCGNKTAMWIDSGIHAREWISHATGTYLMRELVEMDDDHPDLTLDLDWYFLPVVNPDGYLHTQTDERFWRKTRSPNGDSGCFGTDPNRNWGYHWGTGGSSSDPCSDLYMGSEPFSEIENKNMRDFLLANKDKIKFYNSLHSFSQLVLLPWGFGYEQPDNYDDLYQLGMLGAEALMAVHGSDYEVGCIPCLLYPSSGGTLDWTLGVAGIPFSYGMELRDQGNYGFVLPADQIIPTGEEVWAFHMTVAREIAVMFQ